MQSRRSWLPRIEPLRSFSDVAVLGNVALADPAGSAPSLACPAIIVGPEGGWSQAERTSKLPRVRLASTVLRTETAAVAAGALLVALRDGLVTATEQHSAR
jgi:RsmE family RNA methyltransferase